MPLPHADVMELITLRHSEWCEHQRTWRWLADSFEGGDRYRFADYAIDPTRPMPIGYQSFWPRGAAGDVRIFAYDQVVDRNLVPHRQEMDDDGFHLYAMRIARTPIPELMSTTVEMHLSKIYGRDVKRDGPPDLQDWWENVDGWGTAVGQWVTESVAPLLLVLGQLDVVVEHPRAQPDARVETRADSLDLSLSGAVARVVLPENVVWWRLDERGRYTEVLVCERDDAGRIAWRHWTDRASDLYTDRGELVPDRSYEHTFGRPPVVRVFDRRKPRCRNVGRPRYQGVADLQKAVYNGWSEVILSDSEQTHAQLCAPEEYCVAGAEIPVGESGRVLPMRPIKGSDGHTSGYQSPAFIEPPKGAVDSVAAHTIYFQDQAHAAGALAKPAGMSGGTSTAQSGISKVADQQDANAVLGRVAEVLEQAERSISRLVLTVLGDGPIDPRSLDQIEIEYPRQFDLFSAADVAQALDAVQRGAQQAGSLPLTEAALLNRLAILILPGLDGAMVDRITAEIDAFTAEAAAEPEPEPMPTLDPNAPPDGNDEYIQ